MLVIALVAGSLLPVYLYALIGSGVITLTLANCIGVLLLSGLAVSVLAAIAALSVGRK